MSEEERAPLLQQDDDEADAYQPHDESLVARLNREPITLLSQILFVATLVLLLLFSIFVGLFAGAEHRLSQIGDLPKTTVTESVTSTKLLTTTTTATTTTTVVKPGPTQIPKPEVCTRPECVILAASVLSGLNETADPCEEFYEYANGGWIESHPLPSDKGQFGSFNVLAEQNDQVVKQILDKIDVKDPKNVDEASLLKLKNYYGACLNENLLDNLGVYPLLQVVRSIRELFPLPKKDKDSEAQNAFSVTYAHDLTQVLSYLHSIDVSSLFTINIEGDAGVDPDFMTLWFYQSDLGLPSKEFYLEKEVLEEYRSTIKSLLYSLDDEETEEKSDWPWPWPWPNPTPKENRTERAERLSHEVISFETKLAKYGADMDTLLVEPLKTYNPRPLANLTKHLPYIDFPGYVSSFAPRNFPSTVIVTYPPYVKHSSALIAETTPETLQAYFVLRAALQLSPYLGPTTEPWKAVTSFNQGLSGVKKGTPVDREKWCLGRVAEGLGFLSGRFFVREVFGPEAKSKARSIIENVVETFNENLSNLKWMEDQDKKSAAKKASALEIKVGYPTASPNVEDPTSVARWYSLVRSSPADFFGNVLSSRSSEQIKLWQRLGKRRDKGLWEMVPSEVNAYYEPPANEIVFPAGILRPPFFSEDWPLYSAYGAFAAVAAHELTHAFDSAGRLYNPEGKLESWWSEKTGKHFDVRKECLAEQYSRYTVDDGKGHKEHVNGNLTSGENIGDSGLINAYRAWRANSNSTTNFKLPGLEKFSEEQLFFLSFARVWAISTRPSSAIVRVRTDPHSPPKYRVEGTVSNIPEFAKTFNCSAKAKLNPRKRCQFW